MKISKMQIAIYLMIAAGFILSMVFYDKLPDSMASHWNAKGQVDDYMSKSVCAFLLPGIMIFIVALFAVIVRIDPLKANIEKFRSYYEGFIFFQTAFLLVLHIWMLLWNTGIKVSANFIMPLTVGGLYFFLGMILGKIKRNWFLGIRTPWTLSNETVWRRTHEFSGTLFKVAGLIAMVGALFAQLAIWFVLVPILAASVIITVYSYVIYKRVKASGTDADAEGMEADAGSGDSTWDNIKEGYLQQVEKSLMKVSSPRKKEVLEDVACHLDQKFSELADDDRTWENYQKIITEMGPAGDYGELLSPASLEASTKKFPLAKILMAVVIAVLIWMLLPYVFKTIRETGFEIDQTTDDTRTDNNTVIERSLKAGGIFDNDLFDFKTNTVFEFPDKVKFWDVPKWMAEKGIDIICVNLKEGMTLSGNGRVQGSGGNICKFVATDSGMDCSHRNLLDQWQQKESQETIDPMGWDNLPKRFFFKSRSDDSGIIEITHIDDINLTIKFKYKLFESTEEPKKTQSSEFAVETGKRSSQQFRSVTVIISKESIVFEGKELKGWEEFCLELMQVPNRKNAVLKVLASLEYQKSKDWLRIKALLAAWTKEYGFDHLEFTAADKPDAQVEANGVWVELLGVCEHPSVGKQWWGPDGDLLEESPYDDDFGRAFPKDGEKGYKFAIRYRGMARKNIEAKAMPLNFKTTNGGAIFSTSKKNGQENIKRVHGYIDERITWLGAAFDEDLINCDITIGVSLGVWKSEYTYEVDTPNDAVEWVIFKNVSLKPNAKTDVEIDIEPGNLDIRLDPKSNLWHLVVPIDNPNNISLPKFKLRYYRGNPKHGLDEAGKAHSGWHNAGPIEPGNSWNERTRDFSLADGQYEFHVVLDYNDNVSEINEDNNRAVLRVEISNGQIAKKSDISDRGYRSRRFVRIVAGKDEITFQGKKTSLEELADLLEQVPNRDITVLEVGFTKIPRKRSENPVWQKAAHLQKELGFEYLSFVGKHKLGAVSGGTRNYLVRAMKFGEEIVVNLPSAEETPLVYLRTIEFRKNKAFLRGEVTSHPKTKWDIEIAFFDEKMERLDYVFKNYENSGIIPGVAANSKETIEVGISKMKNLEKAKFFELSIKQAEKIN